VNSINTKQWINPGFAPMDTPLIPIQFGAKGLATANGSSSVHLTTRPESPLPKQPTDLPPVFPERRSVNTAAPKQPKIVSPRLHHQPPPRQPLHRQPAALRNTTMYTISSSSSSESTASEEFFRRSPAYLRNMNAYEYAPSSSSERRMLDFGR
jgi:hypothetical protein